MFPAAYLNTMNNKDALKILNLKSGMSLEDTKKAYRILAKKYHPDVAGNNLNISKNAKTQETSEKKMKEINLAFRHLAPQLKSQEANPKKTDLKKTKKPVTPPKKEPEPAPAKQPESFFWIKIVNYWDNFFNNKTNFKPSSKTFKRDKTPSFNKKTPKNPLKFNEILKDIHPAGAKKRKPPQTNKNKSKGSSPYNGYQKYMALKKKIKAMQPNKSYDMSIGKIQKISPINPVERIK